jgi:lysophospholipase L1-like esterase
MKVLCAVPLLAAIAAVIAAIFITRPHVDYNSPTPTEDRSRPLIVALGDSFTSGEGADKYLAGTSTALNTCHRANSAYPFLVARELDDRLVAAACSGALMAHITERGQHPDAAHDVYGWQRQIEALRSSSLHDDPSDVDVVVLTIGGNDAGFSDVVEACLLGNCLPDTRGWLARLNGLDEEFYDTFSAIAAVVPDARKLAMTYPDLIAPGSCEFGELTSAEVAWVRQVFLPRLDQVVTTEAANAGFEVVDNTNAFVGARICERGVSAKEEAANTIKLEQLQGGHSKGDLLRGSFHPNPLGHQLLAADLLRALKQPAPTIAPCKPFSACPDVPPPLSEEPQSGTEQAFPVDSGCSGDRITAQEVVVVNHERSWDLTARPGTTYCYREWAGGWHSGRTATGTVRISTGRLVDEEALSIEVLTQQPGDMWTRTVIDPTPRDHPPGEVQHRLLHDVIAKGVAVVVIGVFVLGALFALAGLPWFMCHRLG